MPWCVVGALWTDKIVLLLLLLGVRSRQTVLCQTSWTKSCSCCCRCGTRRIASSLEWIVSSSFVCLHHVGTCVNSAVYVLTFVVSVVSHSQLLSFRRCMDAGWKKFNVMRVIPSCGKRTAHNHKEVHETAMFFTDMNHCEKRAANPVLERC